MCSEKERMLVQLLSPLFTEIDLKNLETFRPLFFYSHLYEELVVRISLPEQPVRPERITMLLVSFLLLAFLNQTVGTRS